MTEQAYIRRWVRILVLLALAAPLVRAPGIMFPSVVPKAFYFQALTALVLALVAVAWATNELGSGTLDRFSPRHDPFLWAFLAFVLVSAASAALGDSPSRGLLGTMERRWGVLTWTSFLGFYLVARIYLTNTLWRRAVQIAAAVATAVALYGLLRTAGLWPGEVPTGWARIESTLGNAGYLGAYLALGVALTAHLALRTKSVGRRILFASAALVQVGALLGSGTRAAVLGMAVSLLVLTAIWALAADATSRRIVAASVVVLAVGGSAVFLTTAGDPYVASWWDRLLTTLSTETSSARFRLIAWTSVLQEAATRPLFGAGPETFEQVWSRHFDPAMYHVSSRPVLDRAHNVLVHLAVTTGLLGLVAYLGMWAAVGHALVRTWRRGTLSGPATFALAFGAIAYFVYLLFWFEDHSSFLLFIVLAGVAGHAAHGSDREDGRRPAGDAAAPGFPAGGRGARLGLSAVLLALSAFLAWHNVRVLNAARSAWDGEYAMDAWKGAAHYQKALATDLPGSETMIQTYLRRVTFLANHGDSGSPEGPSPRMERALAAADEAVDGWKTREPENAWVHIRRSRLCALNEDVFRDGEGKVCARRELERAIELSPRRIRYRHWLADHHLSAGDPGRALEVLNSTLDVYGSFGETYFYRARVHWTTGDREAAVRQSRIATSLGWEGQPSAFVQRLAEWLAGQDRAAEAARMTEEHLGLRYAGLRRPDLQTNAGRGFEPWDLQLAARLPVLHLRAGDEDAAVRSAEFVIHRLRGSGEAAFSRERMERFVHDVGAGRSGAWIHRKSLLEAQPTAGQEETSRSLGTDTTSPSGRAPRES